MTTPKKTSQVTEKSSLGANDYILGIYDPLGNPETVKITNQNFLGNVSYSAKFTANLTVTANGTANVFNGKITNFTIGNTYTPSSSTDTANAGKMWFDANYLYIAVANNTIKRIALNTF